MVRLSTDSIQSFLSDDRGGGTVMGLLWFALVIGTFGLAIEITDGSRERTLLQAAADAAALAGVVELPNETDAVTTAVDYASNGAAVRDDVDAPTPEDVTVGTWNRATRALLPGGTQPDAIMVRLRQAAPESDALPVNFLRRTGLITQDIEVQAVAQRYVPDCLREGLIANGRVDISSNNGFVNQICIHGQSGVGLQKDNYFARGVNVSMPDLENMLTTPNGAMTSNPGLPGALHEQSFKTRLVPHVGEYMDDLLTKQSYVLPAYVNAELPIIVKDETWNFADLMSGRVYHVQCAADRNLEIPANTVLVSVVLISDCNISVGAGVSMISVILASRAGGGGTEPLDTPTIGFSDAVNLGLPDNCTPGGGVQIFSNASVRFSSSMTINGVQVVAKGNIALAARENGTNGINAHAGQDIRLTSSNMFGICTGGSPQFLPVWYYRLVT